MKPQRAFAIVLRQYYLMRGSMTRIVPLFGWVAIDILLWGFITRFLNNVSDPGYNFVPALLGAVLFWDFMQRVMQGVSMSFLEDVWSRNFLNVFATPLQLSEYLTGLVLTSILGSMIGLVAMLLLASLGFGLSLLSYGALLLPFLLVLFLFGITLGIVAVATVLRLGPAAEWFIWPIPAMIAPFAGVFYPISTLPEPMRVISYMLPPAYVFEGMRAIVSGKSLPGTTLLLAVGLAGVYLLAACAYFASVHRRAVRTGLLARYSAESVV
jgi:ABC-2 type transport system permease protein